MDPNTQLQYLRKEHQDIRRFLGQFGAALDLINVREPESRRQGLRQLRDLETQLQAILHHCDSEERNLEAPYGAYLQPHQLETLRQEHQRLGRLTPGIVAELQFATTNHIDSTYRLGQELTHFLGQHIAYEETLLTEIERGLTAQAHQLAAVANESGSDVSG